MVGIFVPGSELPKKSQIPPLLLGLGREPVGRGRCITASGQVIQIIGKG